MVKNSLAKRVLLFGGIALAGCGATNRDFSLDGTFGDKRDKTEARFFVGSSWVDANRDNHVDDNEFYSKDEYRIGDKMTIIADIKGYEGELTTRLWNGTTGNIVKTSKEKLSGRTLVEYNFKTFDLYYRPFGGEGKYVVAWYINDEPVEKQEFKLRK